MLSRGLVAAWLFNEGTGITSHDLSCSGNEMVISGSSPVWASLSDGFAILYDGSGDYYTGGNKDIINTANEITVYFVVKAGEQAWKSVIHKLDASVSGYSFGSLGSGGNAQLRIDTSGGINQTFTVNKDVFDDIEHTIVFGMKSGIVKIWRDSVLEVDTTYNHGNGFSSNQNFRIGRFFTGYIGSCFVWNKILSTSSVLKLQVDPCQMFEQRAVIPSTIKRKISDSISVIVN